VSETKLAQHLNVQSAKRHKGNPKSTNDGSGKRLKPEDEPGTVTHLLQCLIKLEQADQTPYNFINNNDETDSDGGGSGEHGMHTTTSGASESGAGESQSGF